MWNVSLNLCIGAKRRKGTRKKHACSSTQSIKIQKIRNSLIIIIIIYINISVFYSFTYLLYLFVFIFTLGVIA